MAGNGSSSDFDLRASDDKALRVAERLGADATVVTLIVDSGLRYLSTDLYRR